MLPEALNFLFTKGRESAPTIVTTDAEPDHVYFLRNNDGSLSRQEAEADPDAHTALSLQAIVERAPREADRGQVWYSARAVTLRYGPFLRDRITLDLLFSEPIKQLIGWRESRSALSQAELIRSLRTTFRDSIAGAGNLIEVLKKVKFNQSSAINAEVGHGRASIGKELMGEVTGTGAIPEYVTFDFPVFANACFRSIRASVECALEPDASTGSFRVIPLPGTIETAIDVGTSSIGALLGEQLPADFPLFYGAPERS